LRWRRVYSLYRMRDAMGCTSPECQSNRGLSEGVRAIEKMRMMKIHTSIASRFYSLVIIEYLCSIARRMQLLGDSDASHAEETESCGPSTD